MPGVKRIFAGDEVSTDLLATSEMFLDPEVLFDLAFEDDFGGLNPCSAQIFALRNHANTDHVIVLRDIPEPAFLRNISHGSRPFVQARISERASVVSPDGDFIELRVFDAPVVANGGEGFATRTIQRNR